jgi:hypothetical protein
MASPMVCFAEEASIKDLFEKNLPSVEVFQASL